MKIREGAKKVGSAAKRATHRTRRLFRVNLANTLTLLNGVSGFVSVVSSINKQFELAALLIFCGVIFDYLDGKAARIFSEESSLGKELDSLSDLITFGVAPAALVAALTPSLISYFAGGLFVLSAALRLGRFNVQEIKGVFFGLPSTINGLLLPAFILGGAPAIVYPWYLIIMAFMMNAPLRIPKLL